MARLGGGVKEEGCVDAGMLAAFPDLEIHRSDVEDSVLLAQLAGDKKLSRFTQATEWYELYAKTLGDLAWQITGFRSRDEEPPQNPFTLEKVALDLLADIVTAADLEAAREMIHAFDRLPADDPRVQVYESFSLSAPHVDLQVAVSRTPSTLSAVGVTLETTQEIENLFRQELLPADLVGRIRTFSYRGVLNEEAYAFLRQAVIDKLGPRRTEWILKLDIG